MPEPILFYSKTDCSLCDKAWPDVASVARRHGLDLRKVDIEADSSRESDLYYRHRFRIPVVEWRGVELAWGRIDRDELEAALLEVASRGADGTP